MKFDIETGKLGILTSLAKDIIKSSGVDGSHDWEHTIRVLFRAGQVMALLENEPEYQNLDNDLIVASILLHDVADHKYNGGDYEAGPKKARELLREVGFDEAFQEKVAKVISEIPWSAGKVPSTLEGEIVQDADRIDALGVIGISRCLMYTGAKGGNINDVINHFYSKLFRIPDNLNTRVAARIAAPLVFEMRRFISSLENELYAPIQELKKETKSKGPSIPIERFISLNPR